MQVAAQTTIETDCLRKTIEYPELHDLRSGLRASFTHHGLCCSGVIVRVDRKRNVVRINSIQHGKVVAVDRPLIHRVSF